MELLDEADETGEERCPYLEKVSSQAYLKKIETFQINKLTHIYENWENNNKQSPEWVESRK